jgi:hypothetical protein
MISVLALTAGDGTPTMSRFKSLISESCGSALVLFHSFSDRDGVLTYLNDMPY